MYDKDGSLRIATQSHDLNEIINARQISCKGASRPYIGQSARWMMESSDQPEYGSSRPLVPAVAASTPDKDLAYQVGYLLGDWGHRASLRFLRG